MNELTFWNGNHPLQSLVDALHKLIPHEGEVANKRKNPALEKFRKAQNCYYDLYNNGLCNRAREFAAVYGITSSTYKESWRGYGKFNDRLYYRVERTMEAIVVAAAAEQLGQKTL